MGRSQFAPSIVLVVLAGGGAAADPLPPAFCDALLPGANGTAPTCLINRTRSFQDDSHFALAGGLRLAAGAALTCEVAECALEITCASGDIELEPASLVRAGNITLIADTVRIAAGAIVSASGLGLDDSPHDYYGDRHVQGAGHGARRARPAARAATPMRGITCSSPRPSDLFRR